MHHACRDQAALHQAQLDASGFKAEVSCCYKAGKVLPCFLSRSHRCIHGCLVMLSCTCCSPKRALFDLHEMVSIDMVSIKTKQYECP